MKHYLGLVLVFAGVVGCGTVTGSDPDGGSPGVDADLRQPQPLTVTVVGEGTVTSDPGGIACAPTCMASFDPLSTVTLTAAPSEGALFLGWSGACSGTASCSLTMDGAKSVEARFARHASKRWLAHVSFPGQDIMDDIAIDGAGNVVVAGTATPEGAGGGNDLYAIKYSGVDGSVVWQTTISTGLSEYSGGVTADAAGNVYLAGTVLGLDDATVIGGKPITGDLFGNIVIMRLAAATGQVEWVQQWGGNGQDRPNAVAVDGDSVYVAGETSSTEGRFGDLPMYAASTGDIFLVKARASDGVATAQKVMDGNSDVRGMAIGNGHVLVGGDFDAAMTVDRRCFVSPATFPSGGMGRDGMVLDFLTSDLSCQWAHSFGDNTNNDSASAMAAHPDGGWVVTGSFQGNILFAQSGSSLTSRGGFDAFAVRYEADGDHVWSFRYGDTGFDRGQGVAVARDGAVILSGDFASKVVLGAFELTGADNMYVTRMSPGTAPVHEWAVSVGGDGRDFAEGVVVDSEGNPYALSSFSGITAVQGEQLTARGDSDAYVVGLVR